MSSFLEFDSVLILDFEPVAKIWRFTSLRELAVSSRDIVSASTSESRLISFDFKLSLLLLACITVTKNYHLSLEIYCDLLSC